MITQPITTRRKKAAPMSGETSIFERVRTEVDLHKVLPPNGAREFDGYYLTNCIHPDHTDTEQSMLVFRDGVNCRACNFHADTTKVFQMFNPGMSAYTAAERLLVGDYKMEAEARVVRSARELDQDLAARYHLELAKSPVAVAGLEAMGFTRGAIRHFQLGLAEVWTPILPKEYELVEGAPNIEWRERDGEQQPYQRQVRFAVPVFEGGKLKQFIYRKWHAEDLGGKVQMEAKAGTQWLYNADALKTDKPAVFSSGWGDVVVQWQWGVTAVSGISGDGQSLRKEWLEKLGSVRWLYCVTDADAAGGKLWTRFKEALPWAKHIVLPYAIGTKKDVRDFHLEGHTATEYNQLMRMADIQSVWKAIKR